MDFPYWGFVYKKNIVVPSAGGLMVRLRSG